MLQTLQDLISPNNRLYSEYNLACDQLHEVKANTKVPKRERKGNYYCAIRTRNGVGFKLINVEKHAKSLRKRILELER